MQSGSIPAGWTLWTADFSCQARGTKTTGIAALTRSAESLAKWYLLPEELTDSEVCHRLGTYVRRSPKCCY
jgi:hypothetical protein